MEGLGLSPRKGLDVTLFYPDISSHNSGISLAGVPAVCCKSTQGRGYLNPDYARAKADAEANGVFFFAYHFLEQGNAAAQAAWCYKNTGNTPLMLDFEPWPAGNSFPTLLDAAAFVAAYRDLGGIIHLIYFPHWYWQNLGSPCLNHMAANGLYLVSSNYPGFYSDSGPGWAPYGGMAPAIWQYTSSQRFGGQLVDFNAFKGTLADLKSVVTTGDLIAPKVKLAVTPASGLAPLR